MKKATAALIAKWALAVIVATTIYFVGRAVAQLPLIPQHYYELPIVISPLVTIGVSFAIFVEYFDKSWGDKKAHLLAAIAILIGCIFLSSSSVWWGHLLSMLFIFVVFISWDVAMLCSSLDAEVEKEVKWGHLHVNLPTFVAIVLAGLYLTAAQYFGWLDIIFTDPHQIHINEFRNRNNELARPIEVFTIGLIAFHLFMSGFSYLFVAHAKNKGDLFWRRWFT